jgi:serine/threonine-protein kinase HipA
MIGVVWMDAKSTMSAGISTHHDELSHNQTGIRGPTLKNMFEVTRRHMPITDVIRLLDMVVFNVLACNTDAHEKNYSIVIRANGSSLAPIYDVMCGEVWENVTKKLSQKIAGKSRGDHLKETVRPRVRP